MLDFRQNGIIILRLSPDWIKIITNIKSKRTKPDDIKTTGAILQDFFATSFPSSIFETLLTPYYVSVWNGNLSHVLFLWSFIKDKNPHIGKYFIQGLSINGYIWLFSRSKKQLTRNLTIFNMICWVAWSMGQMTHRPIV